jgi:hypothetical protein
MTKCITIKLRTEPKGNLNFPLPSGEEATQTTADFSSEPMEAMRNWHCLFQGRKGMTRISRVIYPQEIYFRSK